MPDIIVSLMQLKSLTAERHSCAWYGVASSMHLTGQTSNQPQAPIPPPLHARRWASGLQSWWDWVSKSDARDLSSSALSSLLHVTGVALMSHQNQRPPANDVCTLLLLLYCIVLYLHIYIALSGGLARRDTGKNPGGPDRRGRWHLGRQGRFYIK